MLTTTCLVNYILLLVCRELALYYTRIKVGLTELLHTLTVAWNHQRDYPANKLQFLALKRSITEKFHDYLRNFTIICMKPLLRSSRIITLSDIRFHYGEVGCNWPRWLAELTNYNFSITYRSGKHNADADGLSHLQDSNDTDTLFSDVLKTAYKVKR